MPVDIKELMRENLKKGLKPSENFMDGMLVAKLWVEQKAEVVTERYRRFKKWLIRKTRTRSEIANLYNTSDLE